MPEQGPVKEDDKGLYDEETQPDSLPADYVLVLNKPEEEYVG